MSIIFKYLLILSGWFKNTPDPVEQVKIWSEKECIEKITAQGIDAGAAEYILMTQHGKSYNREKKS